MQVQRRAAVQAYQSCRTATFLGKSRSRRRRGLIASADPGCSILYLDATGSDTRRGGNGYAFMRSPDAADLSIAAMTSWRRTASAKSGTV